MRVAKHTTSAGGKLMTENLDLVDFSQFHRVISIEEDPLPQLLEREAYSVFHHMNEDEEVAQIDLQMSPMFPLDMSLAPFTRDQPVGMKALQRVNNL